MTTITYYTLQKSANRRSRQLENKYPSALWGTDRDTEGYFVTGQRTSATVSGLETFKDVEGVKFLNDKSQIQEILDKPTVPAKAVKPKAEKATPAAKSDSGGPKTVRSGTLAARVLDLIVATPGDFDTITEAMVPGTFANASLARDWARYVIMRVGTPKGENTYLLYGRSGEPITITITKRKGGRQVQTLSLGAA